ncbi:MAG: plastocyanin/azurin family copper-binding protein [Actinomycetota bacterium]|nr:plastocyanin/azurin family copper-binding protein [Actinomycetota bacterium]
MNRRTRTAVLAAGVLASITLVAACGEERAAGPAVSVSAGGDLKPDPTGAVALRMEDIRFDTTSMTVQTGETVEFNFTNVGKVPHDAFIGDAAAQAEHEIEMIEMAGQPMSGHSTDEPAVVVDPGKSGSLTYTFDTPGTYEVGCHQPGHYAAGMKIVVTVG